MINMEFKPRNDNPMHIQQQNYRIKLIINDVLGNYIHIVISYNNRELKTN